ncbi:unnamed protein product [Spirodela intermedia]|uniref:Uncharacterized protein n=1 Tax=Spirodela intermedia TaxID=51605 RepID=A0A7I8IU49_SPIIN|nr:unnamed protein product [Spirodela intermedia]CAA6661347.1 unnamed protein product [Spirodela intermedia]
MDFELRMARQRLEKEQRERKERARLRQERERRAKAEAAERREALEAAQRAARLDAARAQQLAEQQIEESLLIGNGIIFCQTLEAVHYSGYGDKIKLPPSCFTELSNQGALDKGPMCFRLSRMTHSGVLEFTAREGSVELPPHVWSNLFHGIELDFPLVEVKYVSLPKGTYAKLQPEDLGFSDLPYHKAVLETSLRRHTTLSQGDVITVLHGDLSYKLRVLELKPSPSVSVIETDVEVDIIEPEDSASENQRALVPLELGNAETGTVEEGSFNYYKFPVDEFTGERIASGELSLEVSLQAESAEGADTDLYVSRHPVIFPTKLQHGWSCHDVGSKALVLSHMISNRQWVPTASECMVTEARPSTGSVVSALPAVAGEEGAAECRNCRRLVSAQSIVIHEAFCARHNVVCQHEGCGAVLRKEEAGAHVHCSECGQALRREQLEKHLEIFHRPVNCPCGAVLEKEEMARHQAAACPLRLITCRFCGDAVRAGTAAADARDRLRGLCEHESVCGSRTTPCDACGRSVMLKDMDIHLIAVHQNS